MFVNMDIILTATNTAWVAAEKHVMPSNNINFKYSVFLRLSQYQLF